MHLNLGEGILSEPLQFVAGDSPSGLAVADFDNDGHVDVVASSRREPKVAILLNRTFDPLRCRIGSVGAALGPPEDVLLVNGSRGSGKERTVDVAPEESFEIFVDAPSCQAGGPAPFVLYAWSTAPTSASVQGLPSRLGLSCMETFLSHAAPRRLKHTWNNVGKPGLLGHPSSASSPAPLVVFDKPGGLGIQVEAFVQGLILDCGALNGLASSTNGVRIVVE